MCHNPSGRIDKVKEEHKFREAAAMGDKPQFMSKSMRAALEAAERGDAQSEQQGWDDSNDDLLAEPRVAGRSRAIASESEIPDDSSEKTRKKGKSWFVKSVLALVVPLLLIALAVMAAFTFWLDVYEVQRSSMDPALSDGDIAVFRKTDDIKRGDIIAFYHDDMVLIKRVIAVGGDLVSLSANGDVTLNGDLLVEEYIDNKEYINNNAGEDIITQHPVPSGRFFVMGDQRGTSTDSRHEEIGTIRQDQIVGKLFLRVWPLF